MFCLMLEAALYRVGLTKCLLASSGIDSWSTKMLIDQSIDISVSSVYAMWRLLEYREANLARLMGPCWNRYIIPTRQTRWKGGEVDNKNRTNDSGGRPDDDDGVGTGGGPVIESNFTSPCNAMAGFAQSLVTRYAFATQIRHFMNNFPPLRLRTRWVLSGRT